MGVFLWSNDMSWFAYLSKAKAQQVYRYIEYQWQAQGAYRLHSPFVYHLYTKVMPHRHSAIGDRIEALKSRLRLSDEVVEIRDFGAGTAGKEQLVVNKPLAELVRYVSRRRKEGELLYRLCTHFQPKRCLEFGTHLGISGLYQCAALEQGSRFVTMEGAEALAERARTHFAEFGYTPEILTGEFSGTLSTQLDLATYKPDYVFIDGNHREQATLDYFHQVLPHIPNEGIIIFDDIHWSAGMQRAWEEIIRHPEVTVSIDLFFLGICFIRRKQAKEHFILRF